MLCRCVPTGVLFLRGATATALAMVLSAGAATSARARPCDAIQQASGEFVVGKPFAGKVVRVLGGATVRVVPLNQKDDARNWCDVELEMYGPARKLSPAETAGSQKFLTDFALHQMVTCIPQPSSRRRDGDKTIATFRRGEHVIASCNVDYALGYLRQVVDRAR